MVIKTLIGFCYIPVVGGKCISVKVYDTRFSLISAHIKVSFSATEEVGYVHLVYRMIGR